MKIFMFLLCAPIYGFCQTSHRAFEEIFFTRQPSARADAMGKAYTSLEGDLASVHYNPAGIATIRNPQFMASYLPPNHGETFGFYTFFGASSNIGKHLTIAASNFKFDFGKTPSLGTTNQLYTNRTTLSIASQPIKNLMFGVNVNYLSHYTGFDNPDGAFYFDFGMLKKINFSTGVQPHAVSIGASIANFSSSILTIDARGINNEIMLPVITRYGVSYQTSIGQSNFLDSGAAVNILVQSDYQMLLNSDYRRGIRLGGEVTVLNFLSLRLGYFQDKTDDYGLPQFNRSRIKNFTYGGGIYVPVNRLTRLPLSMRLDYTKLPEEVYRLDIPNPNRFRSITLRLQYAKVSQKD